MSHDLSDNAIIALDEQIAEMMAEITRRKRIRNSLLKIARIPPEILGRIFQFAVAAGTLDQDFSEIQKGSYNFLLVCHHWHEVGRCTEELWRSWGNNLEDWRRLCTRSGTSALDLVLNYRLVEDKSLSGSLDETLQAALKDRATRDVIRKVHLRGPNRELLLLFFRRCPPKTKSSGIAVSSRSSYAMRILPFSSLDIVSPSYDISPFPFVRISPWPL